MKFKLLEPLIIFVFRTTFVVQMLKGKRQAEKKNRTPQLLKCSAELMGAKQKASWDLAEQLTVA